MVVPEAEKAVPVQAAAMEEAMVVPEAEKAVPAQVAMKAVAVVRAAAVAVVNPAPVVQHRMEIIWRVSAAT